MTFTEKQLRQDLQNLNVPVTYENLRKMARSHSLSVNFLKNVDGVCYFNVPSQSDNRGVYEVKINVDDDIHSCTCADFTLRESPICKHILRSKKFIFDYPHQVHMTEQDRKEYEEWSNEINSQVPDPQPEDFGMADDDDDDFDHFLKQDMMNYKETYGQSLVGGGHHE